MTQVEIKPFPTYIPRHNFPAKFTAQSREDSFVNAFRQLYLSRQKRRGIHGKEFSLAGFGVADFIHAQLDNEAGKVGHITAFEMKLTGWKRAVSQAYRYTYFANRAIVVVPPKQAKGIQANLDVLRKLGIGVWIFDKDLMKIRKLITPKKSKAKLASANEKARSLIAACIK